MTHHHVNAIEIKKSSRYEFSPVPVFSCNTPLHLHLSSVITGSLVVGLMEYSWKIRSSARFYLTFIMRIMKLSGPTLGPSDYRADSPTLSYAWCINPQTPRTPL